MSSTAAIVIVVMLFGGMISGLIASNRGVKPAFGYFLIGAIIPILGIIVAAVAQPSAPAGMIAVDCQTCNARQNIPAGAATWRCWRCQTDWHLPVGHPAG